MDVFCISMVLEKYLFRLYFYIEICKFAVYFCHNIISCGQQIVWRLIPVQAGRMEDQWFFCKRRWKDRFQDDFGMFIRVRDFGRLIYAKITAGIG